MGVDHQPRGRGPVHSAGHPDHHATVDVRKLRPAPPDPWLYRLRRLVEWLLENQVPTILFIAWLAWIWLT